MNYIIVFLIGTIFGAVAMFFFEEQSLKRNKCNNCFYYDGRAMCHHFKHVVTKEFRCDKWEKKS